MKQAELAPLGSGSLETSVESTEPSGSAATPNVPPNDSGSGGVLPQRRIKNWHKFQHFKDRRPPWIKLYREVLDSREMMSLSSDAFRFIVCLWLMASEDEDQKGTLPSKPDIAFRLRISEAKCCDLLKQVDVFLMSDGCQVDAPETEGEKRKRERQSAPLTDLSFMEELKKLYRWVDFDKEVAKMQAWLLTPKGRGRKLSRAFMVKWLSNSDKPVQVSSVGVQGKDWN